MTQTNAFLLTLLLEVPVVIGILALGGARGRRLVRAGVVAVAASAFTHPLLWLAADHVGTWPSLLTAEVGIAVVEAILYVVGLGLRPRTGLLVSFVANGLSLGVGLILYALA